VSDLQAIFDSQEKPKCCKLQQIADELSEKDRNSLGSAIDLGMSAKRISEALVHYGKAVSADTVLAHMHRRCACHH
jgi:hypothetical protein